MYRCGTLLHIGHAYKYSVRLCVCESVRMRSCVIAGGRPRGYTMSRDKNRAKYQFENFIMALPIAPVYRDVSTLTHRELHRETNDTAATVNFCKAVCEMMRNQMILHCHVK